MPPGKAAMPLEWEGKREALWRRRSLRDEKVL
jgi:hypothetical protein